MALGAQGKGRERDREEEKRRDGFANDCKDVGLALDVTIQAQVLGLIRELRDRLNTAILLITHDLGVIAENADRVIVMYAGKKIEEASVIELFESPQHPCLRIQTDMLHILYPCLPCRSERDDDSETDDSMPALEEFHAVEDLEDFFYDIDDASTDTPPSDDDESMFFDIESDGDWIE